MEGEEYAEVDGDFYHEECFKDCAVEILLEQFGVVKGVAGEDDGW